MHRVRLFSIALVVCSLGVYSRAHAQQPATPPDGWVVLGGMYALTFTLRGFMTTRSEGFALSGAQAASVNAEMRVGGAEETITVRGASPTPEVPPLTLLTFDQTRSLDRDDRPRAEEPKLVAPSNNVVNLQCRTTSVLPIRLDVSRAGTSLQVVKPLVVDQEVNVTLRYKRRG